MLWAKIVFWLAYCGVGIGVGLLFISFHRGQRAPDKVESTLMAFTASAGLFCMGMIAGALLQ